MRLTRYGIEREGENSSGFALFGLLLSVLVGLLGAITLSNLVANPSRNLRNDVESTMSDSERKAKEYVADSGRGGSVPSLSGAYELMRWGPILGGFFTAMGFTLLGLALGAGFGIVTSVSGGAGAWAVVTFIIAAFIGGYIAARALPFGGTSPALLNATVVWGLLTTFGLLFAAVPLGNLTQSVGWAGFIATIIGLGAALFGGWVGRNPNAPTEIR
ncbi:MAG: hypothetical protein M1401_03040 [Chloroflexi bacterium]|nr:hypothetical protein [Chloroflexota bacterium]MCL5107850.1 hypothetical protein [Chloroflexota bacterium]